MNLAYRHHKMTEEEYLQAELLADIRHEYIDGEVYAMAGTKKNHNIIAVNMLSLLQQHLRGKSCQPYASDIKVKVNKNFFYPDVMVDCSEDDNEYFTENPTIIVEVLSKSTRQYDKTLKREQYLKIPTLQEYILIEQDFVDIEIQRRSNGWQSEHFYLDDPVQIPAIGLETTVSQIYYRVKNEDMEEWLLKQEESE
ncbi:Uma2 family endonuclease [Acinetobacter puyangensis]|uniref:Endonuclease, Uma2 family (Restriction endonuclease fold) n=1 Tax=Acinetobacter puyangensis TaxID=1096779 RepID=A0A240E5U9_9GAMM|nr:Uma2 family endonuclease [Acinetobacter puyangensis]SNX43589.1 Endonuclease, Uma2 family (restriction endonuclease fold) [Acinetobacter puyangensis]